MIGSPWVTFDNYYKRFGSMFKMYVKACRLCFQAINRRERFIWGDPMVVVTDAEATKRILATNLKNYQKDSWSYKIFEYALFGTERSHF